MILLLRLGVFEDPDDDDGDPDPGISRYDIPGLLGEPLSWGGVGEAGGWAVSEGSRLLIISDSACFFFQILLSCNNSVQTSISIRVDLDNDDDIHDEDTDAGKESGQDALEDHHNDPHRIVVCKVALLSIAPTILIAKLIMALT